VTPGNSPGTQEFADYLDVDPSTDYHIEVSYEELKLLRELKKARDAYYELCTKLRAREQEPTG